MALEDPRMSMAATRVLQMWCTFCSTLFSTTNRCTVVSCVCMQQPDLRELAVHGLVPTPTVFLYESAIMLPADGSTTLPTELSFCHITAHSKWH